MMRFRPALWMWLPLTLLPLLQACGQGQAQPAAKDQIVVAQGIEPESLDPLQETTGAGVAIMINIFDPLVTRGAENKITPAVADSWRNVDPLTWEFKLHQGITFHDGATLDASAVKFVFDQMLDPNNKLRRYPFINMIKSAEAPDPSTLILKTDKPYAPLVGRLTTVLIPSPKAYTAAGGTSGFGKNPVGSGPFKFVEWKRDDYIKVEANPGYWRGAPKVKTAIFKGIPEGATRVSALKTGAVDIISVVPPNLAKEIEDDQGLRVATVRSQRNIFIGMNALAKPFTDVRVRQAMNYAVDVDTIIKDTLSGRAYRTAGPVGPPIFGYDPDIKPYPYDPDRARKLLAEAGFPNGFETTFDSPSGRYVQDKEVSEAVSGYLAKVGVKATVKTYDWANFFQSFLAKKFQGLYFFGVGNETMDTDYVTYLHYAKAGRGIYYNSPETDDLIAEGQRTFDPEQRTKIYKQLLTVIQEQAPWIFLYDQQDIYGVSKRLNWKPRTDETIRLWDATWG